jgi:hypothetical protein
VFNFFNVNIIAFKYGTSVTGIGVTGTTKDAQNYAGSTAEVPHLSIPYDEIQDPEDIFSLLRWRSELSKFEGRETEIEELSEWAGGHQNISAKFIIAGGGIGKTRLAAEFGHKLRLKHDWACGFIDLREPNAFQMRKSGTLLIVDYPEEQLSQVSEFLRTVAQTNVPSSRLRILFLTRNPMDYWLPVVDDSKASGIVQTTRPLMLEMLQTVSAYEIFCSAQEKVSRLLDTVPRPFSLELFENWSEMASENKRSLLVIAAAVHSAFFPDENTLEYSSRDVVAALVRRELSRLRGIAKDQNFPDENGLARILAIAAISGGFTVEELRDLADADLELGLPPKSRIIASVRPSGFMDQDRLLPPTPDIIAAALAVSVFGEMNVHVPECIWIGIKENIGEGIERFGRLADDAIVALDYDSGEISSWITKVFENNPRRCLQARPFMLDGRLPIVLRNLDVCIWKTLAEYTEDDIEKSPFLNNLSFAYRESGEFENSRTILLEAIEINEKFLNTNPQYFHRELGINYANLGYLEFLLLEHHSTRLFSKHQLYQRFPRIVWFE